MNIDTVVRWIENNAPEGAEVEKIAGRRDYLADFDRELIYNFDAVRVTFDYILAPDKISDYMKFQKKLEKYAHRYKIDCSWHKYGAGYWYELTSPEAARVLDLYGSESSRVNDRFYELRNHTTGGDMKTWVKEYQEAAARVKELIQEVTLCQ